MGFFLSGSGMGMGLAMRLALMLGLRLRSYSGLSRTRTRSQTRTTITQPPMPKRPIRIRALSLVRGKKIRNELLSGVRDVFPVAAFEGEFGAEDGACEDGEGVVWEGHHAGEDGVGYYAGDLEGGGGDWREREEEGSKFGCY